MVVNCHSHQVWKKTIECAIFPSNLLPGSAPHQGVAWCFGTLAGKILLVSTEKARQGQSKVARYFSRNIWSELSELSIFVYFLRKRSLSKFIQNYFSTHLRLQKVFVFTLVIPKVEPIISWQRISYCNSLTHFKLQVVDIVTFQTKCWTKTSIFFPKKLCYPIKNRIWVSKQIFILPWKMAFFYSLTFWHIQSDFYWLDVIFRQNGNVFSKEHFSKCLAKCHF